MKIAGDEIEAGFIERRFIGFGVRLGEIVVPEIGGFGVVKIRSSKKLEAEILSSLVDFFKP